MGAAAGVADVRSSTLLSIWLSRSSFVVDAEETPPKTPIVGGGGADEDGASVAPTTEA